MSAKLFCRSAILPGPSRVLPRTLPLRLAKGDACLGTGVPRRLHLTPQVSSRTTAFLARSGPLATANYVKRVTFTKVIHLIP